MDTEEYRSGCHIADGHCLDPDVVFDVGGGMMDYPTIAAAVQEVSMQAEGTIMVHVNGGMAYSESLEINEGAVVAIIASDGAHPSVESIGAGERVVDAIGPDTYVYLEGMRLVGNNERTVALLTGSILYLDQCEVIAGAGHAAVDVRQVLESGDRGGAAGERSYVTIRNSTIWANNNSNEDLMAAVEVRGSSANIEYSTIVNVAGTMATDVNDLGCVPDNGAPLVNVRNSILFNRGEVMVDGGCSEATVSYSAVTDEEWTVGGNMAKENTHVNESDVMMVPSGDFAELFVSLAPPSQSDLRLSGAGQALLVNVAQRGPDDLPFDIDGDERPPVGDMDYAGADLPGP
ncbi:MAG: hypothetical protein AAGF11_51420 [Myxococcota bacterium]